MVAKTGTRSAAEAVLLVNSVRKMMNAATAPMMMIGGMVPTKLFTSTARMYYKSKARLAYQVRPRWG